MPVADSNGRVNEPAQIPSFAVPLRSDSDAPRYWPAGPLKLTWKYVVPETASVTCAVTATGVAHPTVLNVLGSKSNAASDGGTRSSAPVTVNAVGKPIASAWVGSSCA